MELKTLLFMEIATLKEKKLIESADGPLTKDGEKLLNELSQICHDIMLNESDTFDGVPYGTDTREIFDSYISIITGNSDVTLLAFLYAERENGYKHLREVLKDSTSRLSITLDNDDKESNVINFTKKHTTH